MNFLAQRTPAERTILAIVGVLIAGALVVAFAWLPLERSRARLKTQLPTLRASIPVLELQADEAKRLRAMPPVAPASGDSLASFASASGRPLAGAQVTVIDAKTVAVNGSDVSFGSLVEWIAAAQATQGLRVESARIEALPVAGRVRADLRLTRS
jgi:general secretion pathway protein M